MESVQVLRILKRGKVSILIKVLIARSFIWLMNICFPYSCRAKWFRLAQGQQTYKIYRCQIYEVSFFLQNMACIVIKNIISVQALHQQFTIGGSSSQSLILLNKWGGGLNVGKCANAILEHSDTIFNVIFSWLLFLRHSASVGTELQGAPSWSHLILLHTAQCYASLFLSNSRPWPGVNSILAEKHTWSYHHEIK